MKEVFDILSRRLQRIPTAVLRQLPTDAAAKRHTARTEGLREAMRVLAMVLTPNQLITAMEEAEERYGPGSSHLIFGIRRQNSKDVEWSCHWDDGEPTDESLGGTCTIGVSLDDSESELARKLELSKHYWGKYLVLYSGTLGEYGEDDSEIILTRDVGIDTIWRV